MRFGTVARSRRGIGPRADVQIRQPKHRLPASGSLLRGPGREKTEVFCAACACASSATTATRGRAVAAATRRGGRSKKPPARPGS